MSASAFKTCLAATLSAIALLSAAGMAQTAAAQDATAAAQPNVKVTRIATGLAVTTSNGTVVVEPWSDRIIHVRRGKTADWAGNYNPAVIAKPEKVAFKIVEQPDSVLLSTSAVTVRVNLDSGFLSYLDAAGAPLTDEGWAAASNPATTQSFGIGSEDAIYGLGQHQTGRLNNRGLSIRMQQANSDVAVPMAVSSRGFGILWNNASVTQVDVALPQTSGQLIFRSEAGGGVDYDFIMGPDLDTVIAGYRDLTGDAPMMARWTWGLWQSKERYQTQDELLSIAARYRAMKVPFDAVVQDWQYWQKGQWGSHVFDPARYPDPAAMVKTLHDEHVHTIISVWQRFDLGLDNLNELDKAGAVYPTVYNNVYPAGVGRWYDAFSPVGRDIYWKQIMGHLGTLGFDGWWLDGSEAELGGQWGQMRDVTTAAGPGAEVYNASPLLHTTAVYAGASRDVPDKRAFILTRSAYAGQQRNAAITWSGDTVGTWDVFQRQIPAALNFSVSGIPYWSADIGGFFGGSPKDPAYAELFTRWYQFAVFNPMFRVHGTGEGKEIWAFDDKTQQVLTDYDRLRYRLLPYIYATSWQVTSQSGTMMRPLAMDFRDDRGALDVTDQYMFGPSLLVSPVIQPSASTRSVYLPGKQAWYDFWTGARTDGGQVAAAKADIATIPLFVRAGSILPLGPVVQYADEKSAEATELRVYPGVDGTFELYDDAGDGDGYRHRQYATIALSWNDADHQLTIGDRQGQYPGMATTAKFRVTCGAAPTSAGHDLVYSGKAATLDLKDCR